MLFRTRKKIKGSKVNIKAPSYERKNFGIQTTYYEATKAIKQAETFQAEKLKQENNYCSIHGLSSYKPCYPCKCTSGSDPAHLQG